MITVQKISSSWEMVKRYRGQIIKVLDRPRSYRAQVENGYIVERNKKHLLLIVKVQNQKELDRSTFT
ncbi:hypothetical protein PR048_011107 [Dryococelus australis]|uniref:Uncharacterized protein n=1 Tax=Dryococelus australis TaxID=614101 RepID=A0ABQ9HKM1_9NEOP|nr:hypothetical protein PR048_011107 [Dryococelus australis]